jgi:hypothetical protein
MRLKDVFVFCLASLAAAVPWTARGISLADPRHQRRQEAAEILRKALRATADMPTEVDIIERYRSSADRAIQLLGPDAHAARQLTAALRDADVATTPLDGRLKVLRDRIEQISQTLAFVPIMEAEMPRGFPSPTPIEELELKQYPPCRMAQTEADSNPAFWTLFNHIKQNKIAMTAPVEMRYESTGSGGLSQRSMAFLYGSRGLGETGPDGPVLVIDVPPQTVISIGVRGERTRQKIVSARGRLMEWIDVNSARYRPAGEMRVMGYNSPFVPPARKYFEVQIPVTVAKVSTVEHDLGSEFDLSDYVWKKHVLLAFAPSRAAATYAGLRGSWDSQSDAVSDRYLLFVEVLEEGESRAGNMRLPSTTAARLREQFKVESGVSTFILVGKDGTVKSRQPQVRLSGLFDLIDAMPMRRAEISRQSAR